MSQQKNSGKIFWDLQCPYSKENWEQLPEIKAAFVDEYDFPIHLTSLLVHPQAFTAQCTTNWVAGTKGT
jgi:protein-disulfide isomerase